jgi:quinol monooxygenase YgiN
MKRRAFITTTCAIAVGAGACASLPEKREMYGMIGKLKAKPGSRDELIAILLEGSSAMPGCLSYVVAKDSSDADAIWITEVWESRASHAASLGLPSVRSAIVRGRPLIASFGERFEMQPVGGHGLALPR